MSKASKQESLLNPTGMYSLAEEITPERARQDISKMVNQRNLNKNRIKAYCKIRREGRWTLSPQGLVYDTEGICRDGQHRLHMVVETGLPTVFWVTYMAPKECIIHLDEQMPRSVKDALKMAEIGSYSVSIIATAKVVELLPEGIYRDDVREKDYVVGILKKYSEGLDFTEQNLTSKKNISRAVRALVTRAWYHEDEERLKDWCQVISTGIVVSQNAREDEAGIVYRNYLLKHNNQWGDTLEIEKYRKGQTALKSFMDRSPMSSVRGSEKDLFPLTDKVKPKEEKK